MGNSVFKMVLRIVLVSLYAFIVMVLVRITMPEGWVFNPHLPLIIFLFSYVFFFNLYTEGSLFINRYLNKIRPWSDNPIRRLYIQGIIILLWSVISVGIPFTAWYFYNGRSLTYPQFSVFSFISSIVFLGGVIGVSAFRNFFKYWKASMLEAEYYKQEKLKADYRVLQNQVNPHFLFNSLNVLISEIKYNPDVAVEFTRKLSMVYRYVLQCKNYDLISLKEELAFIKSYIFLHKVRMGESLNFKVDIPDLFMQWQLPPLTLQIIVENAIKHNIVNEAHNLYIVIEKHDDHSLIVKNNLNPKSMVQSTQTGLSNTRKRYELLRIKGFKYEKTETEFVVTIPLIES